MLLWLLFVGWGYLWGWLIERLTARLVPMKMESLWSWRNSRLVWLRVCDMLKVLIRWWLGVCVCGLIRREVKIEKEWSRLSIRPIKTWTGYLKDWEIEGEEKIRNHSSILFKGVRLVLNRFSILWVGGCFFFWVNSEDFLFFFKKRESQVSFSLTHWDCEGEVEREVSLWDDAKA